MNVKYQHVESSRRRTIFEDTREKGLGSRRQSAVSTKNKSMNGNCGAEGGGGEGEG